MRLLIIDPQNDFLDIEGAALPVPGANADMLRLAAFVDQMAGYIDDMVVTLDSHASVGIERTTFWQREDGAPVAPFTQISAAQAQSGLYRPRDSERCPQVIAYLQALESTGGRTLIVWPVHCVVGTWGHNIQGRLADSVARWEWAAGRNCERILKGQNTMTEQYSAFRADVPRADDSRTLLNTRLLERLAGGDEMLVVAGEALSHCVAASGQDMIAQFDAQRLRNTVFLTDCMSPVSGFESEGQSFLEQVRANGARTLQTTQVSGMFE